MFKLKVIRGRRLRSVQRIFRQDPFVVIYAEGDPERYVRSGIHRWGGQNPSWHSRNLLELKLDNSTVTPASTPSVQPVDPAAKPAESGELDGEAGTLRGRAIIVEVRDAEFSHASRLIGSGRIDLKDYEEDGAEDVSLEVPIFFEDKPAGVLTVIMWFDPDDENKKKVTRSVLQAAKRPWDLLRDALSLSEQQIRYAKALGWSLTKIVSKVTGGYPITFETITIVPSIVDLKNLHLRLTVKNFLLGNPPNAGFGPRFLSLERVDMDLSCSFAHLANLVMLNPEPCPLKKIPDFKRFATVNVERLEFQGVAIDFQVSPKTNRLNVNEMTKAFAVAEVHAALKKQGKDLSQFRFPNKLEVQVVRARNLKAMDGDGLSDPFYVIKVRKEKRRGETVIRTLNPLFSEKIHSFIVSDPSAVLVVQTYDEDAWKKPDFIGQWLITCKWLLIDPQHCRLKETLTTTKEEEAEGWVSFWAPLLDANFRGEGKRGDIHLRIRWVYDPEVDASSTKQVEGLEMPPWFPPTIRSPKKPKDQIAENSLETRLRLGDMQWVINNLNHIPVLFNFRGPVLIRDAKVYVKDLLFGRKEGKPAKGNTPLHTERRLGSITPKNSADLGSPNLPKTSLSRSKSEELSTPQGKLMRRPSSHNDAIEPICSDEDSPAPSPTSKSFSQVQQQQQHAHGIFFPGKSLVNWFSSTSSAKTASSTEKVSSSQVTFDGEEEEEEDECGPSSPHTRWGDVLERGRHALGAIRHFDLMNMRRSSSDQSRDIKRLETDDMGFYSTGVPKPDFENSRGPAAPLISEAAKQDDAEEDAPEKTELDEDGREFMRIRSIEWYTNFKARHGDEGITAFKVLDRFFRGLAPKLAGNHRLYSRLIGTGVRSFFFESDFYSPETFMSATISAATTIKSTITNIADAANQKTGFISKKYFSRSKQNGNMRLEKELHKSSHHDPSVEELALDPRSYPHSPEDVRTSIIPIRRATGKDNDVEVKECVISGTLEAQWEGRQTAKSWIVPSFKEKWKLWTIEIKNESIFFTKQSSKALYFLDLVLCTGLILAENNTVLLVRFGGGPLALRLRQPLTGGPNAPSLDAWCKAFQDIRQKQQAFFLRELPPPDEDDEEDNEPLSPGLKDKERQVRFLRQNSDDFTSIVTEKEKKGEGEGEPDDPFYNSLKSALEIKSPVI